MRTVTLQDLIDEDIVRLSDIDEGSWDSHAVKEGWVLMAKDGRAWKTFPVIQRVFDNPDDKDVLLLVDEEGHTIRSTTKFEARLFKEVK